MKLLAWMLAGAVLWAVATTVRAQAQAQAQAMTPGAVVLAGLIETQPGKTLKKLRDAPDRLIEDAAGLISGYGRVAMGRLARSPPRAADDGPAVCPDEVVRVAERLSRQA